MKLKECMYTGHIAIMCVFVFFAPGRGGQSALKNKKYLICEINMKMLVILLQQEFVIIEM